jgi:hypothetical protein
MPDFALKHRFVALLLGGITDFYTSSSAKIVTFG